MRHKAALRVDDLHVMRKYLIIIRIVIHSVNEHHAMVEFCGHMNIA